MELKTGVYPNMSMRDYLALDAIGSTHLSWLAVSARNYRYLVKHPPAETSSMAFGTALHAALLEPEQFDARYVAEPDPEVVAPGYQKPRATKAYREAVEALGTDRIVLKSDDAARIRAMVGAIRQHPKAARLVAQSKQREMTVLWDRDGRQCRARLDMKGDQFIGDLKTTRNLTTFSPLAITRFSYYRQAAWYRSGLRSATGEDIKAYMILAVESVPPFDVGVFSFDDALLDAGERECDMLLDTLSECERTNEWPGMFPDVQPAFVTDGLAYQLTSDEVAS